MISIKKLDQIICVSKLKHLLPPIVNYYISNPARNQLILASFKDKDFCGILISDTSDGKIQYIFVLPPYRNKGICKLLIHACLSDMNNASVQSVVTNITQENEFYPSIDRILKGLDFKLIDSTLTILNYKNETTIKEMSNLLLKYKRLFENLENKGYLAVKFSEINKDIFEHFKKDISLKFDVNFNVFNIYNDIIEDMSFLTLKDNIPISYCCVTPFNTSKETFVISVLASSTDYIGRGAFFLSLVKTVEECFLNNEVQKVMYTVKMTNHEMIKLSNNPLTRFSNSKSTTEHFYQKKL